MQRHALNFIDTGPDHSEVPGVRPRQMRCFIIALRTEDRKKIVTIPAFYLNAYPLDYGEEHCPDCPGPDEDGDCPGENNDDCPTTGWYYDHSNFDYEHCYHRIAGTVLAFAEIPPYQLIEAQP